MAGLGTDLEAVPSVARGDRIADARIFILVQGNDLRKGNKQIIVHQLPDQQVIPPDIGVVVTVETSPPATPRKITIST